MEIVTSAVGKITEYTVVPIARQASYLICYKANIKKLTDHVKDLDAARERMMHSVEEERRNGKIIYRDVVNWFETVNEVIENATQLHKDSLNANVRCTTWLIPNLILRHQLSRNATKIVKDIVQAQGKGIIDPVGYRPSLDGVATSSSTRGGEIYESRESLKQDIMKALTYLNSCKIGVFGMGGVGKTTLMEEVSEIAKQQKLFDVVVMTHVSINSDLKKIQVEIAELLGLRFDEDTILDRSLRLRHRIKKEKRILVILDDIWTVIDLKKVGIPFGNEHNGCKLLMTSRSKNVLVQMDIPRDFTFTLELMSPKETWSLFQFMAGDVVKDIILKDLAIQVAQICAGLPLHVVTVARAMKNKRDVKSWKDALSKLQCNNQTWMDASIYSALEFSYDSLESDEVRALLLLFALLPGGHVEYSLKVAMGLNILKNVNTMDDARNRHYKIIKSLVETCLLRESKTSGNIGMHDLVRDFATSIARRDKHVFLREFDVEEWPTNDFLKRCTQIILHMYHHTHKLPHTIDCPSIKFFYLCNKNRSLEIPDTFFEGMKSLTVLDLIALNMPSLPTSFQILTDLKSLCLDFCVLKNMDAIKALQNLEILSLRDSSMIKLPREIERLTQLRMLDLSNSRIEVVPPNVISSLTLLEELYMGNTSINWQHVNSTVQNENASIAELLKLPNLTTLELQIRETWIFPMELQSMFEKLKRYKIAIGDVWKWSDIEGGTLKTLMLKLGTNIHLERGIKALIKGVEDLYLDHVDGIPNMLYQLNRKGFPLLKHLHVQNNANMKHVVDSKERDQIHVSFPILETLILDSLKNLEHICHGPLSTTSFGSLSVIKVKHCFQLKHLFSFTMVKELSHLSKIEVCRCNSMKVIVLGHNNSSANNDISNEKIEFLQLRSLTLEHLETLDDFFSNRLTHSKSKQKYQGLEPIVSTPFFSAQVAFSNLDTLKLSSLKLSKIWDDNHYSMYNLTRLIVENCDGLKCLFLSTVVGCFTNLKHLEIKNCANMNEIVTEEKESRVCAAPIFEFNQQTSLDVKIDNEKAEEDIIFETLETLELISLLSLKSFSNGKQTFIFLSLRDFIVEGCPQLKNFSLGVTEAPSLTGIQVEDKNIYWKGDLNTTIEQLFIEKEASHCNGTIISSNLQDLCISKNMDEIEALQNFEILNLRDSSMIKLPTEIERLTELRKLDLSNSRIEVVPPNILSKLTKLEELYMGNTSINWEDVNSTVQNENASIAELRKLPYLTTLELQIRETWMLPRDLQLMFEKLERYKISIGDVWEWSDIKDGTLKTLMLKLGTNIHLEHGIKALIKSVENLYMDDVEGIQNLLYQLNGEGFPLLKHLHVQNNANMKHIVDSKERNQIHVSFPILKTLVLHNLKNLEHICHGPLTLTSFGCLSVIKVKNCFQLKYLFSFTLIKELSHLSKIEVCQCNSMKEIVLRDNNSSANSNIANEKIELLLLHSLTLEHMETLDNFFTHNLTHSRSKQKYESLEPYVSTPFFNAQVAFLNLDTLKLSSLNLSKIWDDNHNSMYNLTSLIVENCGGLKYLFSSTMIGSFKNLKHLEIRNCASMTEIVAGEKEYRMCAAPIFEFNQLTFFVVDNCKELIYLITSSTAKSLAQLIELKIKNCEKMLDIVKIDDEKVAEVIIFENLDTLVLTSLLSLRSFYNGTQTFIFPSLRDFIVEGCPQMKNFSLGVTEAPSLTGIQVEDENIHWKGDLNTTIEQLFIEKEVSHSNEIISSSYDQGIVSTSEREIWTTEMDNALIDAFVRQVNKGNKINGIFTSKAYTKVIKEMTEKFQRPFQKENVKDRWKLLKRNFYKCYDIFKNMSGFTWDSKTHCWVAEPEVWKILIEAKPEASQWMTESIPSYDKLLIACGDDKAKGVMVINDADIQENDPLNGELGSIGTSEQVTLENLQERDNEQDVISPKIQTPQEPKDKRSKKSQVEVEVEGIKSALLTIADTLRESIASHDKYFKEFVSAYERANCKLPISETEVWKLLQEMQVEKHMLTLAYTYLLEYPEKVRALLGLPKGMRMNYLVELMFDQGQSSRNV